MTHPWFTEAKRALDEAQAALDEPKAWNLTSALHRELGQPSELLGLPVNAIDGAHHGWALYCAGGVLWRDDGRSPAGAR